MQEKDVQEEMDVQVSTMQKRKVQEEEGSKLLVDAPCPDSCDGETNRLVFPC